MNTADDIVTALTGSQQALSNLTGVIFQDPRVAQLVNQATVASLQQVGSQLDQAFDQKIAALLQQGNQLDQAFDQKIAASVQGGAIQQAIQGIPVQPAVQPAVQPMAAAAAVDINNFKLVQITGRDANGPVAKEMTVEELFRRDPMLYNSQNDRYIDLTNVLTTFDEDTMRQVYMEPGSRDTPKLRYAMSAYIESPAGTVGPLQTGVKSDSAMIQTADPVDRANLARFSSVFTWSKEGNPWRTPDNFIDFRRLKLKSGYQVTNRNNAVDTSNDVYVYYFNKVGALTMNDATLEVPFDSSNFMLPSGWKVYARYPDGALLYKSPAGVMQAEFPLGTFFKESRAYPASRFENAAQAAVVNEKRRINAIGGLSPDERQSMYQFAAYLGVMHEIKNMKRIRGGSHSHNITHCRRMSVKRNKKMTRSSSSKGSRRGRGKGRARAASMLKSAKQRYYKMGGMRLGLGQSTPQPLQTESPLISQASPV